MKKQITTILAVAMAQLGFAQTSATLYGYVRGEFAFDSRQVVAARDANYIDVVAPVVKDSNGKDLNANPNFNGWGLESRLGVKISGPEFFGMKSDAVLEGHFFGSTESSINDLGLRHAYVQLSNDDVEVLAGQYWHPMFVTNVSPMTYNFNAGSPFQPFNRSPQVRFSTKGSVRFTGAFLTELDFKSVGGKAATSGLPAFHAQLQFGDDNSFVGGFGANYKTLRAGLGEKNFGTFNFLAYAKAKLGENATWQAYGNYGQNPTELLQLGGVAKIGDEYNSNKTLSLWTEFYGDFTPSFEWGIFGGYTRDYGFEKGLGMTMPNTIFGITRIYEEPITGEKITKFVSTPISAWRVSPRLGWKSGNTKLTTELDYTSTTYGKYDEKGASQALKNDATAGNFRVSLSLIQSF
ncbi:MAG: hypothetical protein Q4A00_00460 [Flavobacteriaceae bacterium]|nr:hypothetical protein [Flavobacteriaceae bacterium]